MNKREEISKLLIKWGMGTKQAFILDMLKLMDSIEQEARRELIKSGGKTAYVEINPAPADANEWDKQLSSSQSPEKKCNCNPPKGWPLSKHSMNCPEKSYE